MRYIILLFLLFVQTSYASSPAFSGGHPWLTGPLLTPSARVTPVGHYVVEPYVYLIFINGRYEDNWSLKGEPATTVVNPLSLIRVGLTEKMNFAGLIQGICATTMNRTSAVFGDLPVALEYELFNKDNAFGKIFFQEVLPTGKFKNLEPEKFGTDAGGFGSFQTLIGLGFGKLIHFKDEHYLSLRMFLNGGLGTIVHVKGFNAYGGDPTTRGKIFRGATATLLLGAEYTLTENWALAIDFASFFEGSHRFKGFTTEPTGFKTKIQFSVAPAIEYNFNENIGIIAGSWFSLAGKNANAFTSYAAAINIYY